MACLKAPTGTAVSAQRRPKSWTSRKDLMHPRVLLLSKINNMGPEYGVLFWNPIVAIIRYHPRMRAHTSNL